MNNIRTWVEGETLAKNYLIAKGFKILELNFKTKLGEIDIIALDPKARQEKVLKDKLENGEIDDYIYEIHKTQCEDVIVFVEVKARENATQWNPLEAINYPKQRKISQSASIYLKMKRKLNSPARFDCIAVSGDKIEHIENAFESAY